MSTFARQGRATAPDNPDALYADRSNLASAMRAADVWTTRLERGGRRDYEAAWKLSRADYWIGGHAPPNERRRYLETGVESGRTAAALRPDRPEGHFWMAANMGALAESFGLRAGLRYRKPIKEALERVRRIDPAWEQGSADRALGRWYFKVPSLFGGSHKLAEEHLRASLQYNPTSTAAHYFLAELMVDDGRTSEARAELQKVIDAPLDPEWAPEDRDFKEKARRILESLKSKV